MKKTRVSQQQIAKDLGLSQTLVSMVLNGRKLGVSEESFRQIWSHARRSGYRPKGMLPDPISSKSESVGFLLRPGLKFYNQSPYFGHVQHGLHDYLSEHGISLVFLGIENQLDVDKLQELYAGRHILRGLVVLGEVARPFMQALKKLESRIVSVSAQYPGLCHSVIPNEEQATELIVEHLLSLGHRNFAWLGGNSGMQRSKQRFEAVVSALRLNNITMDPKFCLNLEEAERMEGRKAAEAVLNASARTKIPTAWICFNGTMARGAANYLLQQGIKIPEDISLAAIDHTRICEEEYPTLTGASTVPEMIGRVAGEFFLQSEMTASGRYLDTVLPSELVVRESTGKISRKRMVNATS